MIIIMIIMSSMIIMIIMIIVVMMMIGHVVDADISPQVDEHTLRPSRCCSRERSQTMMGLKLLSKGACKALACSVAHTLSWKDILRLS